MYKRSKTKKPSRPAKLVVGGFIEIMEPFLHLKWVPPFDVGEFGYVPDSAWSFGSQLEVHRLLHRGSLTEANVSFLRVGDKKTGLLLPHSFTHYLETLYG